QFTQLYELSSKMKQDVDIEKGKAYEIELQEAFEQGNYQAQWRIIEAIRKIKMKPPHSLIQSLQDNKIHPIIKTSIIHWLQDLGESVFVHIHKFGLELFINPIDIPSIESNPMTKQIMLIFLNWSNRIHRYTNCWNNCFSVIYMLGILFIHQQKTYFL